MEENGRKWKEMEKSVVDVQIEGVFSIDHPKIEIQIQVKIDHSKDTDTKYCYKYNI